MYKFNLMWNEGPINLIPEEHKDIYFPDSVVRAPILRQEQPSSLGSTLPLCRYASTASFEASFQLAACNQILYFEPPLSLAQTSWYKPKPQRHLTAARTM